MAGVLQVCDVTVTRSILWRLCLAGVLRLDDGNNIPEDILSRSFFRLVGAGKIKHVKANDPSHGITLRLDGAGIANSIMKMNHVPNGVADATVMLEACMPALCHADARSAIEYATVIIPRIAYTTWTPASLVRNIAVGMVTYNRPRPADVARAILESCPREATEGEIAEIDNWVRRLWKMGPRGVATSKRKDYQSTVIAAVEACIDDYNRLFGRNSYNNCVDKAAIRLMVEYHPLLGGKEAVASASYQGRIQSFVEWDPMEDSPPV